MICSRRLQQTTFSDAFFLGALRVRICQSTHKEFPVYKESANVAPAINPAHKLATQLINIADSDDAACYRMTASTKHDFNTLTVIH